MVLAASLLLSLVGAVSVHILRPYISSEFRNTLFVGFLLLPILCQLQLNSGLIRALKRATGSGIFNSVLRPIFVLFLVVGITQGLRTTLTSPAAMLANTVATLFALLISARFLALIWPSSARRVRPRYAFRDWSILGGRLFLLSLIGILLGRADVLLLGALGDASMVGPYYAAVQLAGSAAYGLNAVNVILAPMIAERYATGDRAGLARLVRRGVGLGFLFTGAATLALISVGPWVLGLFGAGFQAAYFPLLIVLGGQCVNAAAGPAGYLMTMTRFEREAPLFFAAAALISVLLSRLLISRFGMLGAATATAAGTIAWNVLALIFVRRRLGVNPSMLALLAK